MVALLHRLQNGRQFGRRVSDQAGAVGNVYSRLIDELLDLGRSFGRRLGEPPHLDRDHGKPLADIAGPRRLDRGIERQEIGLECDVVDQADDTGDLCGRGGDEFHGGVGPGHHRAALAGYSGRIAHHGRRLSGALDVEAHGGRKQVDRTADLVDCRRLFGGSIAEVVGPREQLTGCKLQRRRGLLEPADDVGKFVGYRVGVGLELGKGPGIIALDPPGQLRLGERCQHLAGFRQAALDSFHQAIDGNGQRVQFRVGKARFGAS